VYILSGVTASRALAPELTVRLFELTTKGFIDEVMWVHFDRSAPPAAEYRLTLYPCDC